MISSQESEAGLPLQTKPRFHFE